MSALVLIERRDGTTHAPAGSLVYEYAIHGNLFTDPPRFDRTIDFVRDCLRHDAVARGLPRPDDDQITVHTATPTELRTLWEEHVGYIEGQTALMYPFPDTVGFIVGVWTPIPANPPEETP